MKMDSGIHVLVELTALNGLIWQTSDSFRFQVPPFYIVRLIRGPFNVKLIIDYLLRTRCRLYSEDFAIRHRDYAIDCLDWVERCDKSTQVSDLTLSAIKASMLEENQVMQ
jgi:hypothetical protein